MSGGVVFLESLNQHFRYGNIKRDGSSFFPIVYEYLLENYEYSTVLIKVCIYVCMKKLINQQKNKPFRETDWKGS